MRISVIRNDTDYREALAEIDSLMAKQPAIGSEDGDRLDVLSVLVSEYESSAFPIELPTPIDAIKFRMEQLDLKQRDLVPFIGSRARVSEVLAGKRPLSLTMIRALHKGLGIPAAVLLQEDPTAADTDEDFDWQKFPLNEMRKRGWIKAPKIRRLKPHAEHLMLEFLRPLGGTAGATTVSAMFKRTRSVRAARSIDQHASLAWCARVQTISLEGSVSGRFSRASMDDSVLTDIARLSSKEKGPQLVRDALSELGIHFIVEPHLQRTHLDGAALMSPTGEPIVAMTLRHNRLDHFWFCLLHELAHVTRHLSDPFDLCIDDLDAPAGNAPLEEQADRMAREALVPTKVFRRSRAYSARTPASVIDLAQRTGVHPAVVAGRVRYESNNFRVLTQLIGQGEVRRLFPDVFPGDPS